ncbi:hypothetical protein [Roseivivax sp. CAU 1761]
MSKSLTALALSLIAASSGHADPAHILALEAERTGMGWRISVTLEHPDTGWGHYADAWRIETPDGRILGLRELLHPHVEEQPFTRSLTSVIVPDGTGELHVRAHCKIDGWSAETRAFPMPRGG